MKIRNLLIASIIVAITFASCKKEQGCTNSIADNYSITAEEDNGSCYCNGKITFDNYVNEDYTIVSSTGNTWVVDAYGVKDIELDGVGNCRTYTIYDGYGGSNQQWIGEAEHCACDGNKTININ